MPRGEQQKCGSGGAVSTFEVDERLDGIRNKLLVKDGGAEVGAELCAIGAGEPELSTVVYYVQKG
jgi:hypothetical protein